MFLRGASQPVILFKQTHWNVEINRNASWHTISQRIVNKYLFCFMVMGHCFRFKCNRTGSVLQKFTDQTIPEGSALLWKGTWIKCDCFHFTVLWYGCMNDMFCNWDLYFGGERRDLETNAYIMKISWTKLWQTPTEAYHDLTGTTFITFLVNPVNQWICGPALPQRWIKSSEANGYAWWISRQSFCLHWPTEQTSQTNCKIIRWWFLNAFLPCNSPQKYPQRFPMRWPSIGAASALRLLIDRAIPLITLD